MCLIVVGANLIAPRRDHTHVVARKGVAPDETGKARVRAERTAGWVSVLRRIGILTGDGRALGPRHAHEIARVRFAPYEAYHAGVRPEHVARRIVSARRRLVVGRGLGTRRRDDADMVVGKGFAPDEALQAGVGPEGTAGGIAPRRRQGVIGGSLRPQRRRDADVVARRRFAPHKTLQAAIHDLVDDPDVRLVRRLVHTLDGDRHTVFVQRLDRRSSGCAVVAQEIGVIHAGRGIELVSWISTVLPGRPPSNPSALRNSTV